MINSNNIEHFLFNRYEGNLSEKEEIELRDFLNNNPKFKEDEKAWKLSYVAKENVVFSKTTHLLKPHALFSLKWKWLKLVALLIALIIPAYFTFFDSKENITLQKSDCQPNVNTNYKVDGIKPSSVHSDVKATNITVESNESVKPKNESLKFYKTKATSESKLKKLTAVDKTILKKPIIKKKLNENVQPRAITESDIELKQKKQVNEPSQEKESFSKINTDVSGINTIVPEEIIEIKSTNEDPNPGIASKSPLKEKTNGPAKKKKNRNKFKIKIRPFGKKVKIIPIEIDY